MHPLFEPGIYQHYKGAYYRALFLAQDSENDRNDVSTQEECVVYISLTGEKAGQINVRSLRQWGEHVDVPNRLEGGALTIPRFRRVGD